MAKQNVRVKSYVRKGKLVKQYQRKQDRKNNTLLNTATVISSALGISAVSYLVLRKRYVNNLNTVAKNLKANPTIGNSLGDEIKDITFTIGGLGGGLFEQSKKLDVDTSPITQAKYMAMQVKRIIGSKSVKQREVVPLGHNFSFDLTGNEYIDSPRRLAYMSKPFFKGRNKESIKLAEEIYSWHIKNPTKPINIVSFSAGTNISRDVKYILNKRGVNKVKVVTLGSADFRITPSKNILSIMGSGDSVRQWKSKNSKIVEVEKHRPDTYLKNEDVKHLIRNYLFS